MDDAKDFTLSIRLLDAEKEKHQVSWFGVFSLQQLWDSLNGMYDWSTQILSPSGLHF